MAVIVRLPLTVAQLLVELAEEHEELSPAEAQAVAEARAYISRSLGALR